MGPVNAKNSHRKTGVSRDRTKGTPHVAYSDLHELSAIDLVNLPSVDLRTLTKIREKTLVRFGDLSCAWLGKACVSACQKAMTSSHKQTYCAGAYYGVCVCVCVCVCVSTFVMHSACTPK